MGPALDLSEPSPRGPAYTHMYPHLSTLTHINPQYTHIRGPALGPALGLGTEGPAYAHINPQYTHIGGSALGFSVMRNCLCVFKNKNCFNSLL